MTMPARQSSRPILVKSDHFDSKDEINMRGYKRSDYFLWSFILRSYLLLI